MNNHKAENLYSQVGKYDPQTGERNPSTRKSRQERKEISKMKKRAGEEQSVQNRVKYSMDSSDLYGMKQPSQSRQNQISKFQSSKNEESKSASKRPNLQDFIIDFESINNEMMQNQFDKANIMGYGNKFFSNPANVPQKVDDREANKVPSSLDSSKESETQQLPENSSLNQYMINSMSKSQSIPLHFKSKVAVEKKSLEIKSIDVAQAPQFGVRHKKIAEKYKIHQKNNAPKYNIMSSETIKNPNRGISDSLNALKSARNNYSFMNQTSVQNFQLNSLSAARNSLFQNQFSKVIPGQKKNHTKNLSINSRFINPRPHNNMSKNQSINTGMERTIKKINQDVVDEEKDQSFDQVSMGSLGAGGQINKADLKFDKVMGPSYLYKTTKKLEEAKQPVAKTFMRPSIVNSAQITQVIKPAQSYSPVKQWSQVTQVMKIKPILTHKTTKKKTNTSINKGDQSSRTVARVSQPLKKPTLTSNKVLKQKLHNASSTNLFSPFSPVSSKVTEPIKVEAKRSKTLAQAIPEEEPKKKTVKRPSISHNISQATLKKIKTKTTRGSIYQYQTQQQQQPKQKDNGSQMTDRVKKPKQNFLKTPRHTISTQLKKNMVQGLTSVKSSQQRKVVIPQVNQQSYREISAKKYSLQYNQSVPKLNDKLEEPLNTDRVAYQSNQESKKKSKTLAPVNASSRASQKQVTIDLMTPIDEKKAFDKKESLRMPIVARKKTCANPQGPASSLSGQQFTSKSVLTSRSPNKDADEPTLDYPISASDALKHLRKYLNDHEKQEISKYDNEIYYVGQNCEKKIKGHVIKFVSDSMNSNLSGSIGIAQRRSSMFKKSPIQVPSERQIERLRQMNIHNYGYDDDQGDYQTVIKDHLGYRYEVLEALGSGSFGQAVKCLDHKNGNLVAVKIIRNKKKFQYQAGMELKILKFLNNNDPLDQNNVIRVFDYLVFREHLIISFELLSINLYEFIRNNNFQGVSQNLIRRFAIQILQALKYQQDHNLVHCDLKPENILLKQQNKSGIKIIDYGSSCFMGQRIYTYIQSRFYRAPEIIMGIPYTTAIDIWSFGAIIAELYSGFPLFPGESEVEQLAYIMELYGTPPDDVLKISQRKNLFFNKNNEPILAPNSRGKIRQPGSKKIQEILKSSDLVFLDFLNQCFEWNPLKRMTPLQALQHPWILQGLPEKVLKHHNKMFGQADKKKILKDMTFTQIQGFPKDKRDQTIHEIVREVRLADEKSQTKEPSASLDRLDSHKTGLQVGSSIANNLPEAIHSDNIPNQTLKIELAPSRKIIQTQPTISPGKERKTRKQRKEQQQNITADFNATPSISSPNPSNSVKMQPIQEQTKIKVYAPVNEESDLNLDFDFGSRRKKKAPGESSATSRSEDAEGGSRLNLGAEEANGDDDSHITEFYGQL